MSAYAKIHRKFDNVVRRCPVSVLVVTLVGALVLGGCGGTDSGQVRNVAAPTTAAPTTAAPTTAAPTTAAPTTAAPPSNPGDSKNCGDFGTYAEAKEWFDLYFPAYGDIGRLDRDGDRIPCESLPGAP